MIDTLPMTEAELAALEREVRIFEGLERDAAEIALAEIRRAWSETEHLSRRVEQLETKLAARQGTEEWEA